MIITRSWLEEFIDISDISNADICKKLNSIGLEVDSINEIDIPKNIVVGEVLECQKHPDADKLSICRVDVGDGVLDIVCGAKNVSKGLFVAVAKVGTKFRDGFEIKPVKLRGVPSNGMICSSSEIYLPTLNDGILELDASIGDLILGRELREYHSLNDTIIEIELTANRGDCLSIYGVARELATAFSKPLKSAEEFYDRDSIGVGRVLHIEYSKAIDSSLLYRVVDLKDSLDKNLKIDLRLALVEVESSSKLDSFLKYATHTTGVVIRAYKHSLFRNEPKNPEKANLKIAKDEDGFDSIFSNSKKVSIVGVSQNSDSKALESELMILETSYIHPETISKKIFENRHIECSDIYYRTSRGSEPDIKNGMNYICKLFEKYSSSEIYTGSNELSQDRTEVVLSLSTKQVREMVGQGIENNQIVSILKSLGFRVNVDLEDESFILKVPEFRHDILNSQDVVEEIVRIIGIDNIDSKALTFRELNRLNLDYQNFQNRFKIRNLAVGNGFFEVVTYLFSKRERLIEYGFDVLDEHLELINPIVSDLDTLRSSLILNLLDATEKNRKFGKKSIALFEIGKVFSRKREQSEKIAFIFSGEREKESILNGGKPPKIDFFTFADRLSSIIGRFEIEKLDSTPNRFIHPYQSGKIMIDRTEVGVISKLNLDIQSKFDLDDTFFAEIDFSKLNFALTKAREISKFQLTHRDLSLLTPKNLEFSKIRKVIDSLDTNYIQELYPIDTYHSEELGDNMSLTMRLYMQSSEKTLTDEEINQEMDMVLEELDKTLKIGLR